MEDYLIVYIPTVHVPKQLAEYDRVAHNERQSQLSDEARTLRQGASPRSSAERTYRMY